MKKYYYFIFLLILIPLNVMADTCSDGYEVNGQYCEKAISDINGICPSTSHEFEEIEHSNGMCYYRYALNPYDTKPEVEGSDKPSYEPEKSPWSDKNTSSGTVTPAENKSCESLLGSPDTPSTPAFYLTRVFQVLKYAAMAILVAMSVIDFTTAMSSSDNDALIKAAKKTLIRLIICVIIFSLPYLLKILLKYLNDRALDLCGVE